VVVFVGSEVFVEEVLWWGWLVMVVVVYVWDYDVCFVFVMCEVEVVCDVGVFEVFVVGDNILG